MIHALVAIFLILSLGAFQRAIGAALHESDRLAEYKARNHTWPPLPEEYVTEGWQKIYERRFRQLDALDRESNSYNGYMGAVHAGVLARNFTTFGWGLTKAPQGLVDELKASLESGLEGFDSLPVETKMLVRIEMKLISKVSQLLQTSILTFSFPHHP